MAANSAAAWKSIVPATQREVLRMTARVATAVMVAQDRILAEDKLHEQLQVFWPHMRAALPVRTGVRLPPLLASAYNVYNYAAKTNRANFHLGSINANDKLEHFPLPSICIEDIDFACYIPPEVGWWRPVSGMELVYQANGLAEWVVAVQAQASSSISSAICPSSSENGPAIAGPSKKRGLPLDFMETAQDGVRSGRHSRDTDALVQKRSRSDDPEVRQTQTSVQAETKGSNMARTRQYKPFGLEFVPDEEAGPAPAGTNKGKEREANGQLTTSASVILPSVLRRGRQATAVDAAAQKTSHALRPGKILSPLPCDFCKNKSQPCVYTEATNQKNAVGSCDACVNVNGLCSLTPHNFLDGHSYRRTKAGEIATKWRVWASGRLARGEPLPDLVIWHPQYETFIEDLETWDGLVIPTDARPALQELVRTRGVQQELSLRKTKGSRMLTSRSKKLNSLPVGTTAKIPSDEEVRSAPEGHPNEVERDAVIDDSDNGRAAEAGMNAYQKQAIGGTHVPLISLANSPPGAPAGMSSLKLQFQAAQLNTPQATPFEGAWQIMLQILNRHAKERERLIYRLERLEAAHRMRRVVPIGDGAPLPSTSLADSTEDARAQLSSQFQTARLNPPRTSPFLGAWHVTLDVLESQAKEHEQMGHRISGVEAAHASRQVADERVQLFRDVCAQLREQLAAVDQEIMVALNGDTLTEDRMGEIQRILDGVRWLLVRSGRQ